MPLHCSYHPLSPAKWECRDCDRTYDKQCVPEAKEKERSGNCPRCNAPLFFISESEIQPYWKINAHFFRSALKIPLLYFVLVLCFLQFFIDLDSRSSYILNGFLVILAASYGWHLMRATFEGKLSLPKIDEISAKPDTAQIFAPAVILGVFSTLVFGAYSLLGGLAATAMAAIASILIPAMMIVVGHEKDLPSAFQTSKLIPVGIFLGPSYFGLSLYLLLALLCSLIAADFAHQHIEENLAITSGIAVGSYFILSLMQMFGYAGHQYKHNLLHKATITSRPVTNPGSLNDRTQRIDADICIHAIDGNYKAIVELLETYIKKRSHDHARKAQLYTVLRETNDHKKLEQHAHSLMNMLLVKGRDADAIEFMAELRKRNPEFRLYDAELVFDLAQAASRKENFKLVIWLGKDAHTRLDSPEFVPHIYYLLAETLLKYYQKPDKAKSYLSFVIKNYPEHEVLAKALPLLQSIQAKLN